MMRIEIEQLPSGMWDGEVREGWEVLGQARCFDRERCLVLLLQLAGIEVTFKGTHWVNREPREWQNVLTPK